MPHSQRSLAGLGPFHGVNRAESGIDRKCLGHTQVAIQRIGFSAECMDVADHGSLGPGLAKHVGVAGIEALDGSSLIARGERGYQMFAQTDEGDMSVKGGAVFLTHYYRSRQVSLRDGMLSSTWDKELPIENSIVLISDQFVHNVLIFRSRHSHQVFKAVAQVSTVVHMYVGGTTHPALLSQLDHRLEN